MNAPGVALVEYVNGRETERPFATSADVVRFRARNGVEIDVRVGDEGVEVMGRDGAPLHVLARSRNSIELVARPIADHLLRAQAGKGELE